MFAPVPSWRAALRIARRDVLRHKGRHALAALLVALPVIALSAVDVISRSSQPSYTTTALTRLGTGGVQAYVLTFDISGVAAQGPDPTVETEIGIGAQPDDSPPTRAQLEAQLAAVTPKGDRLIPEEITAGPPLRVADRSVGATWMELDLRAVPGLAKIESGQFPADGNSVAINTALAKASGLKPGDRITVKDDFTPATQTASPAQTAPKTLNGRRVSGVVRILSQYAQPTVIGLPGTIGLGSDRPRGYYVVGPAPVTWPDVLAFNAANTTVVSRAVLSNPPAREDVPFYQQPTSSAAPLGLSDQRLTLAIAVLLMVLQIVLLAGPAFAVGARRNQRMLAVVGATGGELKHSRRIVLANAFIVGLVTALVAMPVGLAIGIATTLFLRSQEKLLAPTVRVGWQELLALIVLGAGTTIAAALIPARQAARLDIVAALTGRRPLDPLRRQIPFAGVLVTAVGIALALWGAQRHASVAVAAGVALTEFGLVATTGAALTAVVPLVRRAPLSVRMAVRDAARQRSRTTPAIAAVMAAMIGALAAMVYLASGAAHDRAQYRPRAMLGTVMVNLQEASQLEAVRRVITERLPVQDLASRRTGAPVDLLRADGRVCTSQDRSPGAVCDQGGPLFSATEYVDPLIDDTGDATRLTMGKLDSADAAALRAGRVLVPSAEDLWPDGTVHLRFTPVDPDTIKPMAPVTLVTPGVAMRTVPAYPNSILPTSVATRMGLQTVETSLIASTSRLPSDAEIERAQAALEDIGVASLYVERGYLATQNVTLIALVIAALTVALLGSLTAVGLAAAEGRADAATLLAVGAAPGMRRRVAAAQAGVVVVLGTVLGIAGGLVAGYCLVQFQRTVAPGVVEAWPFVVPWPFAIGLVVGVPLITVTVAFLTARTKIPLARRATG